MENQNGPSRKPENVLDQAILPGGVSICIEEQSGTNGTNHKTRVYPCIEMVEALIKAKETVREIVVFGLSAIAHGLIATIRNSREIFNPGNDPKERYYSEWLREIPF